MADKIHFDEGEPVQTISNCVVMDTGDYDELELVRVAKWHTASQPDVEYSRVQAYYLKYGSWR